MDKKPIPHPSWIEVDIEQFKQNIKALRNKVGSRLICLPVKANGYGHGALLVSEIAQQAGIDYLGVSCLKEGVELRRHGITLPILVFGAVHEDQIYDLITFNLEFSISSLYKARLVAKECEKYRLKCRVHIEVDTGMRRTGVRPETAVELVEFIQLQSCFEIVGIYSHLATSERPGDDFANRQITIFLSLKKRWAHQPWIWHLANSGGVLHYPESYLDMVRPGLITYGYLPHDPRNHSPEFRPCLSLKSKISYFKVVEANEGISYGHLYKTSKKSRIVTIPIGYGDGYRRSFSNLAPVLIRGKRFQVSGVICMDQFMVDIGDHEAYVGDEVTLIGSQGSERIDLWDICVMANLIPHECLCSFNERLPRICF